MTYDKVAYTGWHSGYPDAPAGLTLATFRRIPGKMSFLFSVNWLIKGEPAAVCARQLLKKSTPKRPPPDIMRDVARRIRMVQFRQKYPKAPRKRFSSPHPARRACLAIPSSAVRWRILFHRSLFEELKKFGVPLEGLHASSGPGTYEAAITHAPAVGNRQFDPLQKPR